MSLENNDDKKSPRTDFLTLHHIYKKGFINKKKKRKKLSI